MSPTRPSPFLLLLLCAACDREAGAPPEAARPAEAPAAARVRARILEEIRAAAAAAPVVVDDSTVRSEVPEKPGPDAILSYFRGASGQVPAAGLRTVSISLAPEGLLVILGCEDSEARLLDRSGSPAAKEAYGRLFSRGLGLRDRLWPSGPPDEERALHRDLGRVESRYQGRFDPAAAEGLQLTKGALRATGDVGAEPSLGDLFSRWQLLEVKRALVGELGGSGTVGISPLAAGPTLGIHRGMPGVHPEVFARVEGPDGMLLGVEIRGAAGRPVPARWMGFVASFRPFATNDLPASHFEREAPGLSGPVRALNALSALLLSPNVERALRLLGALREVRPDGAPPEALPELARGLASQLRFPASDSDRLEAFAREN